MVRISNSGGNSNIRIFAFNNDTGVLNTTPVINFVRSTDSGFVAQFSPDNKYIACAFWGSDTLRVYSFSSTGISEVAATGSLGGNLTCADWSPDGRFIAVTTNSAVDDRNIGRRKPLSSDMGIGDA